MNGAKRVGFEPLPLEAFDGHWCGDFGDLRPCYGPADFELGSPRKFFESFFRQDTLDGAHGNVYRLLVEQLGDIAGGEFALPPFNNFLSGRGINFPSWPTAFSRCFGEVDLFMTELMPEQTEIAGAKPKPFGNDVVWQAIDKGGAHRFILALPFGDWFGEKAGISHAAHYI